MYPIKGTFIDEITYDIESQNWSLEDWREDLDNMQSVGINTVIFVRGFFDDKCIFPSKLLKNTEGVVDLLGFVLEECEKRNMKVYIGMYIKNLTWDFGDADNEIKMNEIFTDEIIERYSHYKSFYGWYIPHEVGNDILNIKDIFYHLSKMCKEKTPDKKVLISPFFYTNEDVIPKEECLSAEQTYHEWDKILSSCYQYLGIVSLNSSTNCCLSGLGPTSDISPFKTLKNCGSSSKLIFLINAPTLVTLLSFLVVQAFFSSSSDCSTIDLNLYIVNNLL